MISPRTLLWMLTLGAALATGCDSCKKDGPKSTPQGPDAAPVTVNLSPEGGSSATPMPPGGFNKFFPKEGAGGFTRSFSSQKEGLVEAKLLKDGNEVAILTIVDAEKLAYAKAKFESATEKLEGFPVMTIGPNQSSVLVKDRYQVKVTSQTLDHEARKRILATFDLKGLNE
jgi:hypothetical protein